MNSGAYVRIKRDGAWQNLLIEELTPDELGEFAKAHPGDGWKWAIFLVGYVNFGDR